MKIYLLELISIVLICNLCNFCIQLVSDEFAGLANYVSLFNSFIAKFAISVPIIEITA